MKNFVVVASLLSFTWFCVTSVIHYKFTILIAFVIVAYYILKKEFGMNLKSTKSLIPTIIFIFALTHQINSQQFSKKSKITFDENSKMTYKSFFTDDDKAYASTDFTIFNKLPGFQNRSAYSSIPIQFAIGKIMVAFHMNDSIYISASTDGGVSWNNPENFFKGNALTHSLTGIRTNSGRVILIWGGMDTQSYPYITMTDNHGNDWTTPKVLVGGITSSYCAFPNLSQTMDGVLWVFYNRKDAFGKNNIYYRTSTNNGDIWSSEKTYLATPLNEENGMIVSASTSKMVSVYSDSSSGNYDIYVRSSIDNGITWSSATSIVNSPLNEKPTKLLRKTDGTLVLIFQSSKPNRFEGFYQNDAHYCTSANEGVTWSPQIQFTRYVGNDNYPSACLIDNIPLVTFSSDRGNFGNFNPYHIWYGKIGITTDLNTPPVLLKAGHTEFEYHIPIWVKAYVDDDSGITEVKLIYNQDTVTMFDDGLHNDEIAGDYIFGVSIGPFNYLTDNTKTVMSVNNIFLPIDNKGILADASVGFTLALSILITDTNANTILRSLIDIGHTSGGIFDKKGFLYSGGFFLSGLTNGQLWANAQATASRISDYLPGKVGSASSDPRNKLYILRSSDLPFSSTWQSWIDAVSFGANFYDGDNDGLYNPIDKNSNGQWDPNEDRPDLIGDMTVWCVYNDGVPSSQRRFTDVSPQGIEIKQTVFAYGSKEPFKRNVIFIRYNILNKGTVTSLMDSVYFTIWTDGDLGDYTDDLVGCDTLLNSAYFYNDGYDNDYGSNAPAFFTQLLQSPPQFIPGLTFTDVNSNGIFDEGIDIPLDSAKNHRGIHLGIQNIPGARNINATSFVHYMSSHPTQGDPSTKAEAKNYMLGLTKLGVPINVCTWGLGSVLGGVNCAQVNPSFMYSGEPVTRYGWINTSTSDQRAMLNVGPFRLLQGKPVDVIAAYIVGRGTSPTNSISVTRTIASYSQSVYAGNFSLPTGVEGEETIVKDFKLYQNYPNPFNPVTNIKYQIPSTNHVTLKVYDILGREVATLVDEVKLAGDYDVQFTINDSRLTSSVYFYQLRSSSYSETKKMIILK